MSKYKHNYIEMLGHVPDHINKRIDVSSRIAPDVLDALEHWRLTALNPEVLDQKTVQLICFAVLLAQTSASGATHHADAAIRAGCSVAELHAAAALASLFRGLAAFNIAGPILEALDQPAGHDAASPQA